MYGSDPLPGHVLHSSCPCPSNPRMSNCPSLGPATSVSPAARLVQLLALSSSKPPGTTRTPHQLPAHSLLVLACASRATRFSQTVQAFVLYSFKRDEFSIEVTPVVQVSHFTTFAGTPNRIPPRVIKAPINDQIKWKQRNFLFYEQNYSGGPHGSALSPSDETIKPVLAKREHKHVKGPGVDVKVRWIMETPNYSSMPQKPQSLQNVNVGYHMAEEDFKALQHIIYSEQKGKKKRLPLTLCTLYPKTP